MKSKETNQIKGKKLKNRLTNVDEVDLSFLSGGRGKEQSSKAVISD